MLLGFVYKELLGIYGGDNQHSLRCGPWLLSCTYFDLVVYDVNRSALCFMGQLIMSDIRKENLL